MVGGLPAALAATLFSTACAGSLELTPSDAPTVLSGHHLDAPSPALPGPHDVLTLYYGSGTDKNRAEYRDSVAIVTESVDASKLVSLGGSARSRNRYWGFSPDSFPVNARVWYPDDPGPHPLVLVVHGNHNMRDFSDPGYDWLGELLASRGYILASVDMNFINGGIRGENDGRGWMLLKHLQAWARFAEDPENPFHGRVDMGNIALIGHSRGGEAVALAAAFNRLTRYPDDASFEFDFGFDIRAVIAIAPVDGQYLPADQRAPVHDVNYLVFHGSHDGDVTSFHGLRQFNRVRFSEAGARADAAAAGNGSAEPAAAATAPPTSSSPPSTSTAPTTGSGTPSGARTTTVRAAPASWNSGACCRPRTSASSAASSSRPSSTSR